jgi:hypothetical protein
MSSQTGPGRPPYAELIQRYRDGDTDHLELYILETIRRLELNPVT